MTNRIDVNEEYLPENTRDFLTTTQAYVGKIGFVQMELKDDYKQRLLASVANEEGGTSIFDDLVQDIYSLLSESSHVMEISPPLSEKSKRDISIRLDGSSFQLGDFLKLRVVMSQHVQAKFFSGLSNSFTPEEFTIYFDGGLFFVFASVKKIPIWSNIGQVVREFLFETLKQSSCFEVVSNFGPTPIHPEIYFITAKYNDNFQKEQEAGELPCVETIDGDLVVVSPDDYPVTETIEYFFQTSTTAMRYFYEARRIDSELYSTQNMLNDLNQNLSKELSEYFKAHPIQRSFSKSPANIRFLLSQMHINMQKISCLESEFRKKAADAIQQIEKAGFLLELRDYLVDELTMSNEIDKSAQLTIMNFAADETTNFLIIQATLLSAFIGAIIGGLIALLVQVLIH